MKWLVPAAVLAVVAVLVGILIVTLETPPSTVREVIWDKQPCRECGMSVSVPAFAAQLQLVNGEVFDFDDPGCLFLHVLHKEPRIHAVFFHAMNADEWIAREDVGFMPTDRSPMDFGWGAVRRSAEPSSISYDQLLERFKKIESAGDRQER